MCARRERPADGEKVRPAPHREWVRLRGGSRGSARAGPRADRLGAAPRDGRGLPRSLLRRWEAAHGGARCLPGAPARGARPSRYDGKRVWRAERGLRWKALLLGHPDRRHLHAGAGGRAIRCRLRERTLRSFGGLGEPALPPAKRDLAAHAGENRSHRRDGRPLLRGALPRSHRRSVAGGELLLPSVRDRAHPLALGDAPHDPLHRDSLPPCSPSRQATEPRRRHGARPLVPLCSRSLSRPATVRPDVRHARGSHRFRVGRRSVSSARGLLSCHGHPRPHHLAIALLPALLSGALRHPHPRPRGAADRPTLPSARDRRIPRRVGRRDHRHDPSHRLPLRLLLSDRARSDPHRRPSGHGVHVGRACLPPRGGPPGQRARPPRALHVRDPPAHRRSHGALCAGAADSDLERLDSLGRGCYHPLSPGVGTEAVR